MDIKQVIVIRKDLKMRRGKEIAQGAHASSQWLINKLQEICDHDGYKLYETGLHDYEYWWINNGYKKVTLQVQNEQELLNTYIEAKEANLTATLIQDEGLTEFGGIKTYTAIAIGPNDSDEIDKVTGNLELY